MSFSEMPKAPSTPPTPKIHCDHDLNITSSGYFVSPNYGIGNYFPNLHCIWRIFGPVGHIIRLHFVSFDVEYSQNCLYDALTVSDGTSIFADVLDTLCGQIFPDDILSKTNSLMLSFITDGNKAGSGFNITYTVENKTGILK